MYEAAGIFVAVALIILVSVAAQEIENREDR